MPRILNRLTSVYHSAAEALNLAWTDDKILRQLARAYGEGKTTWAVAENLNIFFEQLDAWNQSLLQQGQEQYRAYVRVSWKTDTMLRQMIKNGIGPVDNQVNPATLPEMTNSAIERALGPRMIDGLRLDCGWSQSKAVFMANIYETTLTIKTPSNIWKTFAFDLAWVKKNLPQPPYADEKPLIYNF